MIHHSTRPPRASAGAYRRKALHVAVVGLALAGAMPPPAQAQASATAPTAAGARDYAIPAGALSPALSHFAGQAGVTLSSDPALTDGLTTRGLQGRHGTAEGFARLLQESGLRAVGLGGGVYRLERVPAGETTLGTVRVTAQIERSATTEGTGSYATNTVTIGKGEQSLRDIAQSVSVITRQRIEDQGLSDIREALAAAPGVTVVANAPGAHFYSRGFYIGSYQYDGVPLERQLYARGSAYNSSMAIFDRVEIMRGPQGLFEGAGDPSGSVNLVRKRPTQERQLVFTGKAGSWGEHGVQADLGGPLNASATIRGRAVMDYGSADSFQDFYDSKERTAYGALDIDLGPATTLGIGFSREKPEGSLDWTGLPNRGDGTMPDYSRSTNLSAPWSRADKTQDTWYLDLTHHLGGDWQFKASVARVREANELKYLLRQGRLGPPNTFRGDAYYFDMLSRNLGGDAYVTGSTQLWGHKLALTAGANFSRQRSTDIWGWQRNIENLSDSDDQPSRAAEPAGVDILAANRMDDGYRSDKKGLYGVARYELDGGFSLVLGGRLSSFEQTYVSNGIWGYSETTAKESSKFTPFAGLIYRLNEHWSAYGSYADIFKPQSQREISGNFLEPVTGKTHELGLKGELLGGRAQAAFALFRTEQRNVAYEDGGVAEDLANMLCGGTCYRASARVRSQGLEAELSGEVARGLHLAASYTYTQTRYRTADVPSVGYDISANTGVPRHMVHLWANYQLPGAWSRLSVGGGIRSQSRSSDYAYDGREQGGYTLLDARIAYQFTQNLSAALNIDNLTDKTYFRSVSYGRNFYGTPRSALLTLQYRM